MRCNFPAWLLATAAITAVPTAHAAEEFLVGSPRTISGVTGNSSTPSENFTARSPALAAAPENGNVLIAWSADDGGFSAQADDGSAIGLVDDEFEIFAAIRRVSDNLVVAEPFRVSFMGNDQETDSAERARYDAYSPAAAWNPVTDEFLIVWSGNTVSAPLVDQEFEIFGQRVSAQGERLGEPFRISVMGNDSETDPAVRARYGAFEPAVAVDPVSGNYLVVWRGDDDSGALVDDEFEIFARVIDSAGEAAGAQSRISTMGDEAETAAAERQRYGAFAPAAAFNAASGVFSVIWQGDDNQNGLVDDEYEVLAQNVDKTGAPVNSAVRVSNMGPDGDPAFDALEPAIAVDPVTGTSLISWHGDTSAGAMTDDEFEIFGRLLDANSNALGSAFRISLMGPEDESDPAERRRFRAESSATAWNGKEQEFLVAWQGDDTATANLVDDELEVFGRFVQPDGSMPNGKFRVSTQGDDEETDAVKRRAHKAVDPAIAYLGGAFTVGWSGGENGHHQIYTQRAATVHTTLEAKSEWLNSSATAPEPIRVKVTLENTGGHLAENVEMAAELTEQFPLTFSGCSNVREGSVCELGDVPPGEKRSVDIELATDHLAIGDPQHTLLTLRTTSDTALLSSLTSTQFVAITVKSKGGGAIGWLWFALLGGLSLMARRRK